jgi:hypothetical protein
MITEKYRRRTERLADVVAVAEGLPLVELLAEENVNAPPPEHAVALSAEILKFCQ